MLNAIMHYYDIVLFLSSVCIAPGVKILMCFVHVFYFYSAFLIEFTVEGFLLTCS